jgi:hypothetical protein
MLQFTASDYPTKLPAVIFKQHNHHSQMNPQCKYNVTKSWNICLNEIICYRRAAATIIYQKYMLRNIDTDEPVNHIKLQYTNGLSNSTSNTNTR